MGSDGVGGGENGAVFGAADDNEIGGSDGLADGADGEEANISGSDDKGLLNSLTDTILSTKLDLLRAKFAAKAGALSLAANAFDGLASLGSGNSGNNEVSGAGAPNAVGADDGASDDTSVTGDADADNADVVNVAVADGGAGNGDDGDSTESTDEKGLLSSLTDSILRAKLELLKAPLAVKTGALSLAANAINGLASFGSGESGNDVVSGGVTTDGSNAVGADNGAVDGTSVNGAVADDAADAADDADVADVADGAGGAGDADTDNTADSGDGDEVSADSSDGNILESIIKAKLAV